MSVTVMLVVLLAALFHATWNLFVKNTADKHLSMTAVVLGHVPFGAGALLVAPLPDISSLGYILAGALLHVGYQLFLLNSYRHGDLSQVYPLARGVAPLLVAGASVLLLGERLSVTETMAVAAIALGIMSLTLVRRRDGLRNGKGALLALGTGGFIAAYSLVDGTGARLAGTALGFYGCLTIVNGAVLALIMRAARPGVVTAALTRNLRFTLVGGGASFLAYALVTWAFTMAPIPLVTALRETSIIFALILGVVVLKERLDLMKVAATACTLAGACLLRFGR
ncbi:DMT family transporter [Pseudodesulfovibrio indicus]|uniref:DMT family transporter n=1 Tax=Pseudodesulfovibrio indicus TaxID=1716143 RepID=UPI002930F4B0|nr:DMT family transporter [Pseudodesulfovibrio indicus]